MVADMDSKSVNNIFERIARKSHILRNMVENSRYTDAGVSIVRMLSEHERANGGDARQRHAADAPKHQPPKAFGTSSTPCGSINR